MFNVVRHLLFLAILLSFTIPLFALAQEIPNIQVPDTIDGVKEGVLNIGDKIIAAIPGAIAGIWKNEVMPLWRTMWKWTEEEIWQKRVQPAFETILDKIRELLGREVEKRKPLIEQEFEQEKRELQEDIENTLPSVKKSLWERFQALFQ